MIDTRDVLMETDRSCLFFTGEVAVVLGVSTTTVKRLDDTGQLRAHRNRRTGWRYFEAGGRLRLLGEAADRHVKRDHTRGGW